MKNSLRKKLMTSPGARPSPAPATGPDTAGTGGGDGPRRALVALYGTFALAATARATVQLVTRFDQAPLAYMLSLFSGLVYISATIGIATHWSISRALAWVSVLIELVGVVVIGLVSQLDAAAFPDDTVWSHFGSGYVFIPAVLPIIGIAWLWHTHSSSQQP